MIGYEDLDTYGTWVTTEDYGTVWTPTEVAADWAPYQDGVWVWIDPWGWTWVDNSAWGFAPFHYGRWIYTDNWYWIPAPVDAEPVYAPALVAFLNLDTGIGWFPLSYNEYYWPPYFVGINYFTNINFTNRHFDKERLHGIFERKEFQQKFRNFQNPSAVTVIPRKAFEESLPVGKIARKASKDELLNAKVAINPSIVPKTQNVTGPSPATKLRPPANVIDRQTIVKKQPPPAPVPFATQQQKLMETNGKPLNSEELQKLAKPLPAQNVKVVTPPSTIVPIKEQIKSLEGQAIGAPAVPSEKRPPLNVPPSTAPVPRGRPQGEQILKEPGRAPESRAPAMPTTPSDETILPSASQPQPAPEKGGRPTQPAAELPKGPTRPVPEGERPTRPTQEGQRPTRPQTEGERPTRPQPETLTAPVEGRSVPVRPEQNRPIRPPQETITAPVEQRAIQVRPQENKPSRPIEQNITAPVEQRSIQLPQQERAIQRPQERVIQMPQERMAPPSPRVQQQMPARQAPSAPMPAPRQMRQAPPQAPPSYSPQQQQFQQQQQEQRRRQ